jgi:hypothetical protein
MSPLRFPLRVGVGNDRGKLGGGHYHLKDLVR